MTISHRSSDTEVLLRAPAMTSVTFPKLHWLGFQGTIAYFGSLFPRSPFLSSRSFKSIYIINVPISPRPNPCTYL